MRTKDRAPHTLIPALIVLLAASLILCTGSSAFAKGSRHSSGDSGGSSYQTQERDNSGPPASRSGGSDSRSEPRVEPRRDITPAPRPEPRSEPRYEPQVDRTPQPRVEYRREPTPESRTEYRQDPVPERRYEPKQEPRVEPTPQPRTEYRRDAPTESRSNNSPPPVINRSQDSAPNVSLPNRIKGHSEPQVRETTRNEVPRQEITRTETRSETRSGDVNTQSAIVGARSPSRSPSLGAYRKEYADLGDIWKKRIEKRDTPSDRVDRGHADHDRTNVHINFNFFPGCYRHYCFDYDPWYSYPSAYCYYYGLFPPYVRSYRVIWVAQHVGIVYTWVDLPIVIVHRDAEYYSYPAYPDDNYYLSRWRYKSLSSALSEIERAWKRSDVDLLMTYVRSDCKIDVFLKDEYAYTMERQDYFDMTRDAMVNIRTVDFAFYRIRERNHSEIVAYGKHTYYDDSYDGQGNFVPATRKSTVYVSFTLEKDGDLWYVTEVGSSPDKLH